MPKCRFLTRNEFADVEKQRLALAKHRSEDVQWLKDNNATYGWASISEIVGPCVMWEMPWYFEPHNPKDEAQRNSALKAIADGSFGKHKFFYLSKFYWQDWSDKRPPICVVCPNGEEWVIDSKSSNGDGWQVTGTAPNITCRPSIKLPKYHGRLTDGEFKEA